MLGDLLVSAQQAAHKWLREMILSGELPAGQAVRAALADGEVDLRVATQVVNPS